ncbi:hypothetical protein [Shimia aestuarii]|uniref:hypothetical protein n=1 Tax=Shimia aestuarii TaxID=254406 RepID=UPI001FB1E4B1|nr:hypothetical protein [Shimia aestuarii]
MASRTTTDMTADCRDYIAEIEARARAAERAARTLPRTERQAFIYDNTFRNDIEAVAFPLAQALGRIPDFINPTAYCEMMRGLYLTHPNPLMPLAADKVDMHHLCDYLDTPIKPTALYGATDDPWSLDLSDLPETAMLKVADGCKMNILHGPGMPVTPFAYRRFLRQNWHLAHWRRHGELHYRDIPRRLVIEEAILPIERITGTCLMCAFGKPHMILTKAGYAPNRPEATIGGYRAMEDRLQLLERDKHLGRPRYTDAMPARFEKDMLETARLIGHSLPNYRVDFMILDDRCFLGEITVSSAALASPYETQAQEDLRMSLFDFSKLPDCLEQGRKIAADLGWPTETSFSHYAPDDPRLATGGR